MVMPWDFGLPNFETPWMDAKKTFYSKTYHKISRNGKACGWCPMNVTGISQPQFARVCRKCALSLLFESFSFEISRVTQGSSQTYWGSPIGSGTSTRERPGNLTSRALAWGNHWMIALTGYGPKRSEMKVNPTLNEGKCHMLRKCWSSSKTPVLGKLTFSTTFQYFCHE